MIDQSLAPLTRQPTEDAIRDFAYHLYEVGGRVDGRDREDWQEATHRLQAHVPTKMTSSVPGASRALSATAKTKAR